MDQCCNKLVLFLVYLLDNILNVKNSFILAIQEYDKLFSSFKLDQLNNAKTTTYYSFFYVCGTCKA